MTDLIKRDDALAAIDTFKRDFEQSWKVQFSADIAALPAIDPAAIPALQDRIEELNERLTAATNDAKEAEAYAQELEERNKELTLQLLAAHGQAADALDKLTKALEERDEYKTAAEICGKAARAMLAELGEDK